MRLMLTILTGYLLVSGAGLLISGASIFVGGISVLLGIAAISVIRKDYKEYSNVQYQDGEVTVTTDFK